MIGSIIELDEKDLYFYSPSGNALNFSYDAAYGLLNFKSKMLRIHSTHNMKSLELRDALGLQDESFNLPNVYAEHKGEINISNLKNLTMLSQPKQNLIYQFLIHIK